MHDMGLLPEEIQRGRGEQGKVRGDEVRPMLDDFLLDPLSRSKEFSGKTATGLHKAPDRSRGKLGGIGGGGDGPAEVDAGGREMAREVGEDPSRAARAFGRPGDADVE